MRNHRGCGCHGGGTGTKIIDTSRQNEKNCVVGVGLGSGASLAVTTTNGVDNVDLTPAIVSVVTPMLQNAAQDAVAQAGYTPVRLVNASGELIANVLVK